MIRARACSKAGERPPVCRATRARGKVPRRPQARSDRQPGPALGAGSGCWRPSCRRRSTGCTPISCIRRPRSRAMRQPCAACRGALSAACQGHLDQRGVGAFGEARRLRLAGHLHGESACGACRNWRPIRNACASSITVSTSPICRRRHRRDRAATAPRGRSVGHPVDRPQGREKGLRRSPGGAGHAAARSALALRACRRRRIVRRAEGPGSGARHRPSVASGYGAQPQNSVFAALARADLFVLASKKAAMATRMVCERADGGRASGPAPLVSTHAAAIGEFIDDGSNGCWWRRLHRSTGDRACPPVGIRIFASVSPHGPAETLHARFSFDAGVDWIAAALGGQGMDQQRSPTARAAE